MDKEMSSSPSSSSDGSPPRGSYGYNTHQVVPSDHPRPSLAPSLARTSLSTHATERTLSAQDGLYASWEQSDIRGDLASGWGDQDIFHNIGGGMDRLSGASRAVAAAKWNAANNRTNDNTNMDEGEEWVWRLRERAVHPVPPFYPMDARSTRRVYLGDANKVSEDEGEEDIRMTHLVETSEQPTIGEISSRISTACQSLSIQGVWDNMCPSATLCSMERVEMEVNMYLDEASSSVLIVELQRRKGCSVTFHNYRRCLLDAAEGKFDPTSFHQTDGLDKPLGRDRCNQPRASLGRPGLVSRVSSGGLGRPGSPSSGGSSGIARPSLAKPSMSSGLARPSLRSPSFSADDAAAPIAGLKTEGEPPPSPNADPSETFDKAMKALNMAASLIRKDRVDARRLGMESLVLLTDPLRAGTETAKIASRVVLLGTAREGMVWESNDVAVGLGNDDDVDVLFDMSSGLGIRETILEMIMNDGEEKKTGEEDGFEGIEREFTDSLFNLCLTVLSNALHAIEESVKASSSGGAEQEDDGDSEDEGDRKPSPRRRAATEPAVRPSAARGVSKRFIDDTNSTFGCDVLSSLIRILGQAKSNPHDAYHSARCLGVLFKGCGNSHKARARRDLDAKRIIAAALEVGCRSHAMLADASRVAMVALVTDEEEDGMEGEGETTELEGERVREETATEEGQQQQQQQQHCELPSVMEQSKSEESDER